MGITRLGISGRKSGSVNNLSQWSNFGLLGLILDKSSLVQSSLVQSNETGETLKVPPGHWSERVCIPDIDVYSHTSESPCRRTPNLQENPTRVPVTLIIILQYVPLYVHSSSECMLGDAFAAETMSFNVLCLRMVLAWWASRSHTLHSILHTSREPHRLQVNKRGKH